MMRYLLLSSVLLLYACSNAYKGMQAVPGDPLCAAGLRPNFSADLYKAQVQVTGRNLGGLLLIKAMPDSSTRVVFSTETGFKFFDFAFGGPQDFKAFYVLEKLNHKVVVQALRNDFELLLMRWMQSGQAVESRMGDTSYHGFSKGSKIAYYLTDTACSDLYRSELGSKRKKLVSLERFDGVGRVPDSIYIQHFNFNFNISLKKLER